MSLIKLSINDKFTVIIGDYFGYSIGILDLATKESWKGAQFYHFFRATEAKQIFLYHIIHDLFP